MKQLFVLTTALLANIAFATDWTYDSSAGTISDGDWTFAATVKSDTTELTVGAVQFDPGADATLDFSKSITDGSTEYTLVTLNPNFSGYANKANLKTLVLPTSGLTTISKDAFNGCTSLATVTPYLPDCVTTVGTSAFSGAPVAGVLSLKNVVTVNSATFKNNKITKVYFGAALKTINGGWTSGAFDHCTELTTLEFDPGITGAQIINQDNFAYTKVAGTVDFSGFTKLCARIFYCYSGAISKMILSSDLTSCKDYGVFHYLTKLRSVEFTAGVPVDKNFYKMYNNNDRGALSSIITTVKEEYKGEWAAYCVDDTINEIDSTWKAELVPLAVSKGFYLIYKGSGGGGELGEWIYNGTAITNRTYGWGFSATANGRLLTLGNCTRYPSSPSPLNLSDTITDIDGQTMAIAAYSKLFHNGVDGAASLPGAEMVSSLIVPTNCTIIGVHSFRGCTNMTSVVLGEKIVTIGTSAFRGCTSLSTVTPLLPDSVEEVNDFAFADCPIEGDLVMNGIETLRGSSFKNTKITSAYFGSSLKTITGGYAGGAICYCSALTNIVFDSAITNAVMTGQHFFCHNTALKGTMDTRGFKTIGGRPFDNTAIEHLLVGADITSVDTLVRGMYKLNDVTFFGDAPKGVGAIFNEPDRPDKIGSKHSVTTIVFKAHLDSWLPYAANGVLNRKRSTWAREYIDKYCTDLSLRKLLCVDLIPGLKIIIR